MRSITQIVEHIRENQTQLGITLNPPVYPSDIEEFEITLNLTLPSDIKEFYSLCNGLESEEDLFRIIDLQEIIYRKKKFDINQFHIAEYMVYCDMWTIKINSDGNTYQIFEDSFKTVLTNSFTEFLERFLLSGVFQKGALYAWKEEIIQSK
jgi:cell wall assembly regulator SMI1